MKFLAKTFVRNYLDTDNPTVRKGYGILSSCLGIIVNLILSIFKIIVGALSASISIMADGFNNLSDLGSSFTTLLGFKMSDKPADAEHPFGHARYEYITGLIIAFIVLVLAFNLLTSSIQKIFAPSLPVFSIFVIIVLSLSIVLKLFLFLANLSLSKAISSPTLKAIATDSINDVIATSCVLICAIISRFTGFSLDGYVGALVAVMIAFSGVGIIKDMLSPLLGERPTKEMTSKICSSLLSYDHILAIHDLIVHNYGGGRIFATVHAEIDYHTDPLVAHEHIDMIERDFLKRGIVLVVHYDPIVTDSPESDELKRLVVRVIASISPDYSIHDFRAVIGSTRANLIFDVVVPTYDKTKDIELRERIASAIKAENDTLRAVINIDRSFV